MKKSEETEKKILSAALDLFFKRGFAATSINEITASVGLTKGALYTHFKSKEELAHRLFLEFKTKFLDELARSLNEREGNPADKLHHILSFYARFGQENLQMMSFLVFISQELKNHEAFEFTLKNMVREQRKLFSNLIKNGIQQGLFKQNLDPDLTALTIMAINDGILHHLILDGQSIDARHFIRTMRSILFEGILK